MSIPEFNETWPNAVSEKIGRFLIYTFTCIYTYIYTCLYIYIHIYILTNGCSCVSAKLVGYYPMSQIGIP